ARGRPRRPPAERARLVAADLDDPGLVDRAVVEVDDRDHEGLQERERDRLAAVALTAAVDAEGVEEPRNGEADAREGDAAEDDAVLPRVGIAELRLDGQEPLVPDEGRRPVALLRAQPAADAEVERHRQLRWTALRRGRRGPGHERENCDRERDE